MTPKKILLFTTSHDALGDSGGKTGFWYEELASPYYVFRDAGFEPIIISPKGGRPPIDPGSESLDFRTKSVERFAADAEAQRALASSLTAETAPEDFATLFLVGGHGTMWDFPGWSGLSRLLAQAKKDGLPIGAICHGVAGLLSLENGGTFPLVRGRSMTGFTNEEEAAVGLTEVVPFLLQDRLTEKGGKFDTIDPFHAHVVTDGLLVTGQNPASSTEAAMRLVALIGPK